MANICRLDRIADRMGFPFFPDQPLVERGQLLHSWMVRFFSDPCLVSSKKSGLAPEREPVEGFLVDAPGLGDPTAPARPSAWRTRSILENSPLAGNDFPFALELLFCFRNQAEGSVASLGLGQRLPSHLSALAGHLGIHGRPLTHLLGHLLHRGGSPVVRASRRGLGQRDLG